MTPESDAAATGAGDPAPEGSAAQASLAAASARNATLSAAPAPARSAPPTPMQPTPVQPASMPPESVQAAAAQPAPVPAAPVQPLPVALPAAPVGPASVHAAAAQPASGPPAPVQSLPVAVPAAPVGPAGAGTPARGRRRSRTSPDRVQRSFYLSRDLVDRARAAVFATMREPGEAYNVSQLVGRGLEAEVRRLEQAYNDGTPFPHVHHVPSGPSPEGVERIRAGVTAPRRRRS